MNDEEQEQQRQQAVAHQGRVQAAHAATQAAAAAVKQAEARAELVADLDALRRSGVAKFKGSGIDVEFFPAAELESKRTAVPAKAEQPDLCPGCKHDMFKHDGAGLCVEGCTAEECKPKEAS